jgi:RNA exonuclease 1
MDAAAGAREVWADFPMITRTSLDRTASPRLRLLLTTGQMVNGDFPIPSAQKFSNFRMTKSKYSLPSNASPLYSVDCEMCLTKMGLEVTRVAVVNSAQQVIYHNLVQPDHPVLDYLTPYSGVTAAMLAGVTTKLSDVQRAVRHILPPDAILVGHSLHADLRGLRMIHPFVIDTSLLFTTADGRRPKLSVLSHQLLQQPIQCHGHHPVEDARAAMLLVLVLITPLPPPLLQLIPHTWQQTIPPNQICSWSWK